MIADYFKLAWKNLSQRRMRSWLTMIGIFIGVAAIVALISLGQGLENAIIKQFSVVGTDVISVQAQGSGFGPPGTGVVNPLTGKDVQNLGSIGGVDSAVGRIIAQGKLEYNNKLLFGFAQSIPDGEKRKTVEEVLNLQVEKGRLLKDGDGRRIVIGGDLGDDDFAEYLGKKMDVGSKVLIQDQEFEVVGVLKKKGSFILDQSLIMNEEQVIETFNVPKDEYSFIGVRVKQIDDIPTIKQEIEKYLRRARNVDLGEEDFTVETPDSAIKNLKDTLFAVQLFLYIIAGISVVVGGIGITNTMYTAVIERTKEIGIMKAIGASRGSIFAIFAVESGFLGMVGGIIGIAIGMGIASLLVAIAQSSIGLIEASFSPLLIFGALAFSFIIGIIAGVFPALSASKLHPVVALNYTK